MKPYVGITGVTTREQSSRIADQFQSAGFSNRGRYQGMIGYLSDWSFIRKGEPLSDPKRYAAISDLPDIFDPTQEFGANAVHFLPEPHDSDALMRDLDTLFISNGVYERGLSKVVQINRATQIVNPAVLARVIDLMPELVIICQVGREDLQGSVEALIAKLANFAPYTDVFLVDPSQGQGREIETDRFIDVFTVLRDTFPHVQIAVAGGISGDNVADKLDGFSRIIGQPFSIDMESGARDEYDELDLSKTRLYIQNAGQFLGFNDDQSPRFEMN